MAAAYSKMGGNMANQIDTRSPSRANFWAGFVTATLGAIALLWLIPEFVTGSNDTSKDLTPGFMPRVAAWSMVLLGASIALSAVRVIWGNQQEITEESEENEALAFGHTEIVNSLLLALLGAIYVFGLSLLGFVIPSTILLIFLIYLTGYRRKIVLLLVAGIFPLTLELLLWHVLKVPLPQFPLISF